MTGINAENYAKKQFDLLRSISSDLNVSTNEITSKIMQFNKQIKELKKELGTTGNKDTNKLINNLVEKIEKFNDINCIIQEVNLDAKEIRNIAEQLKERISGVVALFSITENKLTIVIAINKNLTNKLDSQKIIKELGSIIGGGGGGKPGIAQAGGSNIKAIKEAIELTRTIIKDGLK